MPATVPAERFEPVRTTDIANMSKLGGAAVQLSGMEFGVLELSSLGDSVPEIANKLPSIGSEEEVVQAMSRVEAQFGARNMASSIHRAILYGQLPIETRTPSAILTPGQSKLLSLIASGHRDPVIARHFRVRPRDIVAANEVLYGLLDASGRNQSVRSGHEFKFLS